MHPHPFDRLLSIMDELREKCPWDRAQTMESIRHLSIEEVYELSEAILAKDNTAICTELGDLLLHIVFYSKIASEQKVFDIWQVIDRLCEKLIRRHPHIYGQVQAETPQRVKENWEQIKLKESANKKVLQGVPKGLPAMIKAYRIQEKVASVGFDWEKAEHVLEKVIEEAQELRKEIQQNPASKERIENELGDLFFSLVNVARFLGINPEDALEKTNQKFMRRFNYIEDQLHQANLSFAQAHLAMLDALWEEAKKAEY
ncbi:MAG: nucleoside triphosphate pyrophosphohydrolase [Bacteroidia bacterium]|nr:nucleoside triphosphate pyrophosphohydrolase [Bacteroidia bacterium]MDW8158667.1 nucleoside triphosphate pyrophosphohydrolase [Bacteroidia bacterium]